MAVASTEHGDILATALDVRRGFRRFVDVPAVDRPAVAVALRGLTDARVQELLEAGRRPAGFAGGQ